MSYLGRLPPEVLRTRYVRAHKALQAAVLAATKLQMRVEMLEAENKALRAAADSGQLVTTATKSAE